MTHTLHRFRENDKKTQDYVMLSMAAQGFNDKNAKEKLVEVFKIMLTENPVNYGDDNQGGIYTGKTAEDIITNATDKAYMDAVYSNKDSLQSVLMKLKNADIGMSVTVTGDLDDVFNTILNAGLRPHTVNLSLGTYGKKEYLPEDNILGILSMCGHGMVCKEHTQYIIKQINSGLITTEEGGKELAKPCTCGIFNVERAEHLLQKVCHRHKEENANDY